MDHCVFHPNHAAVEYCEVCNRALCGHCLWYTEDGHRLCEIHAQERELAGETVLPPETYAEAINTQYVAGKQKEERQPSDEESQPRPNGKREKDDIPYKGNSQDLTALISAVMAITVVLSCMGGAYCLPVAAFILGIVGFTSASKAVDPKRTRLLSGISLGFGGLVLLGLIAIIGFYVMFIIFAIFSAASSAP
jgi:hypothetical protein